MKYQLQYFRGLRELTDGQSVDPTNERYRNAARVCMIAVDSEIPGGSSIAGGQFIHRTAFDTRGFSKDVNTKAIEDLFEILGIEGVWPQPYKIAIIRADIAGGGWPGIVPRVLSVLQSHLGGDELEEIPFEDDSPKDDSLVASSPSLDPSPKWDGSELLLAEVEIFQDAVKTHYQVMMDLAEKLTPVLEAVREQREYEPADLPKFPRLGKEEIVAIATALGLAIAYLAIEESRQQ